MKRDSNAILDTSAIKFDDRGLLPATVQNVHNREVLTLAYMNAKSLQQTLETRETWFWSRSRSELWRKGATSGNTQRVVEIRQDCDGDALVVLVEPQGPACHTGKESCFYRDLGGNQIDSPPTSADAGLVLNELYALLESRQQTRPAGSYTTYLFENGLD